MTQEQLDKFFIDKGYEFAYKYYHGKQYSCYFKQYSDNGTSKFLLGYKGNVYAEASAIRNEILWEEEQGKHEDDLDEELYRMEMDGEYL